MRFSFPVTVRIGPRLNGLNSIGDFLTELASGASGQWITMLDDDARLLGDGWQHELATLPLSGVFVRTQVFQHGPSVYDPNPGPPGWFVPNHCWQSLGEKKIQVPADDWFHQLLVVKRQWNVRLLKGTTYKHCWAKGREK